MKKKITLFSFIFAALLLLLPACEAREAGSLKALTKPYIAQYECVEAKLGNENLLEKLDYILIVLEDKEKLKFIYKPKNGDKQIIESEYTFNEESRELTAEIGILGYRFRQSTRVENGKFTVSKQIGNKELVMKFKAK